MALNAVAGFGVSDWNDIPRTDRGPEKAARQFEAMLLEDVLTKLRVSVTGDTDPQDPGSETMGSIADHALSEALVDRGGIGFSRMLRQALVEKKT